MDLQEVVGGCGDWMERAQDRMKNLSQVKKTSVITKSTHTHTHTHIHPHITKQYKTTTVQIKNKQCKVYPNDIATI
jgi:hypothetical protein